MGVLLSVEASVGTVILGIVVLVASVGIGDAGRELVFLFLLVVALLVLFLVKLVLGLLGLVALDVLGLLHVDGCLVDVPVLVEVPVGAQAQFLGVIIHFLGLQVLLVVAGVPLAVAVVVDGEPEVIGTRGNIQEFNVSVLDCGSAHALLA